MIILTSMFRVICTSCLFGLILLNPMILAHAQDRTVGLMLNEAGAYEGYTIVSPIFHPSVYLVNLQGEIVHRWKVSSSFGSTNRLLDDGALLRVSAAPNAWTDVQGVSGRIEIVEWDGSLRWQHDFVTDEYMLHHDVVPLPNGNLLGIVWDRRDRDALDEVGYNMENLSGDLDEILSERIVEFKPVLPDTIEIVWQWDSWDHLVQDHTAMRPNTYADEISDHPGRIDINTSTGGDWLHFNALDYNQTLDVIAISASYLNEMWVIDHSTTTEEARETIGGNFGLGGRLLYRWGNPQNYGVGTDSDQTLHFLHSVLWITNDLPGTGNLLLFENGVDQPEGNYSTVHELKLPYMKDSYGDGIWYAIDVDGSYKDPESVWTYSSPSDFYSNFLSGQQRLPNGNTLIAEGMTGRIFEILPDSDQLVWEYVNPVTMAGPLSQGDPIPPFGPPGSVRQQNAVFRALRYGVDFRGFSDKDLTPVGPIEFRNDPSIPDASFSVAPSYPNPFHDHATISIDVDVPQDIQMDVFNLLGQNVETLVNAFHGSGTYTYVFDAKELPSGLYFCKVISENQSVTISLIHQ